MSGSCGPLIGLVGLAGEDHVDLLLDCPGHQGKCVLRVHCGAWEFCREDKSWCVVVCSAI